MCRQIHGQTLQDDATCPAPHMSQLVANHHILTEHGRILSDDHSPEEFLIGWIDQQVQSSVKSRKSNVRQACNRLYPLSLGVLPLAVAGLCSYEHDDLPSNNDEMLTDGPLRPRFKNPQDESYMMDSWAIILDKEMFIELNKEYVSDKIDSDTVSKMIERICSV